MSGKNSPDSWLARADDFFGFVLVDSPTANLQTPSASSASSGAPLVAASKTIAKKRMKSKGLRYYGITRVGAKADALDSKLGAGVFCTTCTRFVQFLHGGELSGLSISVKGFDSLKKAAAHVAAKIGITSDEVEILDDAWVSAILDGSRGGIGRGRGSA